MRHLKYLGRLLRELGAYAWKNKAWWLVPLSLILLLLGVLIITGQGAAPAFIYTLF